VETAKKSGRYGRSCRVCKLYFLTSDPNAYTCPWCQKGTVQAEYGPESLEIDTQMLVQEEV